MKVILLQGIKKIGKKHDIKEVTKGYARNFLIPRGLAVVATNEELKKTEELEELEIQQAEEELTKYQSLADQVDGLEIEIKTKVNEEGKLFGAITAEQVSDKLKEKGYKVKKEQIKLKEPLKELGDYNLDIEFPHSLEAKIKLSVIAEEK